MCQLERTRSAVLITTTCSAVGTKLCGFAFTNSCFGGKINSLHLLKKICLFVSSSDDAAILSLLLRTIYVMQQDLCPFYYCYLCTCLLQHHHDGNYPVSSLSSRYSNTLVQTGKLCTKQEAPVSSRSQLDVLANRHTSTSGNLCEQHLSSQFNNEGEHCDSLGSFVKNPASKDCL